MQRQIKLHIDLNDSSKVVITTDSIHINEYPYHELNKNCVLKLPIKLDKKDKTFFTITD